jgi:hypothetical protein
MRSGALAQPFEMGRLRQFFEPLWCGALKSVDEGYECS